MQASLVSMSLAQEIGSQRWFHQTWTEASSWRPDGPIHVRVTYESFRHPSEAQIRRTYNNEALGHDGSLGVQVDRSPVASGDLRTVDVWTDGVRFRYADSGAGSKETGLQFALGQNTDWVLLDGGFLRIAPADVSCADYGVRNFRKTAESVVWHTVWAGFGDPTGRLKPVASVLDREVWTGEIGVNGQEPAISVVHGKCSPVGTPGIAGMTVIGRMLANEEARSTSPLGTVEYVRWSNSEILDRPVVSETVWTDGQGRLTQKMTLVSIAPVSVETFEQLLHIPGDSSVDPDGRPYIIATVQDVRPGRESQVEIKDGVPQEVPLQIPLGRQGPLR
jgi:hypothetical protein